MIFELGGNLSQKARAGALFCLVAMVVVGFSLGSAAFGLTSPAGSQRLLVFCSWFFCAYRVTIIGQND